MGAEVSTERRLMQARVSLRLTAQELRRAAAKSKSEETRLVNEVRRAVAAQEQRDVVRQLAQGVVRQENVTASMRRMEVHVQSVQQRMQQAQALGQVGRSLQTAVAAMRLSERAVPLDRLPALLQQFEQASENSEVRQRYMDDELQQSMQSMTPEQSVDAVLRRVGDEYQLEVSSLLTSTLRVDPQSARSANASIQSSYGHESGFT